MGRKLKHIKTCGVYQIQSKSSPDKIYIGSSVCIHKRWWAHQCRLRNNIHENPKLQEYYNEHGVSDLQYSILRECTKEELAETEQYFMDDLTPYFNLYKIIGSTAGYPSVLKGTKGLLKATAGSFKKGHIGYWKGKKKIA